MRARAPITAAAAARRSIWGVAPQEADPLTIAMDISSPTPIFDGPTATQVTTLSNGMKVASSDLSVPCTTVGVYIDSGSAYESVSGTAHMLQHMAFKSSANTSQLKFVRDFEKLGAVPSCTASRENMVYQVDTIKSSVPEVVGLLADAILAPKFLPWEIEQQKGTLKIELDDAAQNHQNLLQELTHPAAFGGSAPLGKPLMCPPRNLGAMSAEILGSFVTEKFVPSRMVLAASGYDHAELVKLAEASFGKLPAGTAATAMSSPYVGGEVRVSAEEDLSHFALSFKGVGWKDPALVPLCVLNTLMGGGASFSAGGPGKGMYTRLYQNVLNKHGYVMSASVFNAFYNDGGVFGVYGAAPAEYMGSTVQALCEEMKKMAGPISDVELSRAKNQLKSSLLMNLESRFILFEDIGRQVLTYGARTDPAELAKQIDAVTAADLNKVASTLLKSPPSVVVHGDTTAVPRYDVIAKQFA